MEDSSMARRDAVLPLLGSWCRSFLLAAPVLGGPLGRQAVLNRTARWADQGCR